jgi:hypothetical protein
MGADPSADLAFAVFFFFLAGGEQQRARRARARAMPKAASRSSASIPCYLISSCLPTNMASIAADR